MNKFGIIVKKIGIKRIVICAALLVSVIILLALASCSGDGGEPVTVTVQENDNTLTIDGTDGMTVRRMLEKSGIHVDDRDIVTPDRNTIWRDTGATGITVLHYAQVTVTDDQNSVDVGLTGGKVNDAIAYAGFDSKSYSSDVDKNSYLTNGMVIHLTKVQSGFTKSGDKTYYYDGGELAINAIVGSDSEGYFYAGADGEINYGYIDGVEIDGEKWVVMNGAATKVQTESDECLYSAAKDVAKCTTPEMTKEEKIKKAFDYIREHYLEGVLHDPPYSYQEDDWPVVLANDLFIYGKGDCFSFGAAFAYMLKAIGCSDVYACNTGGHGWAEAEGLAYDPEWSMHSNNYPYFAMSLDEECDVDYSAANGSDQQRRKI